MFWKKYSKSVSRTKASVAASNRELGQRGEDEGRRFLAARGYVIIEQNFRTRHGEIDLIARERKDLVFVEIKLRRGNDFGRPQEAVGRHKQERIIKSALQYVKKCGLPRENIRFDVLALGPGPGEIELIRSAFAATSLYTY
jgi:putative endonuclease